jgi:hypothetical protein
MEVMAAPQTDSGTGTGTGRSSRLISMAKKSATAAFKQKPTDATTSTTHAPTTTLPTESAATTLSESTTEPAEQFVTLEAEPKLQPDHKPAIDDFTSFIMLDAATTTLSSLRLADGDDVTESVPLITATESSDEFVEDEQTPALINQDSEVIQNDNQPENDDLEVNDSLETETSSVTDSLNITSADDEKDEENLILETNGIEIEKEALVQ